MDSYSVIHRSEQRWWAAIAALTMGPLFVLGFMALGVFIGLAEPNLLFQCLGVLFVGLGLFIGYQMVENFSWVELEDSTLRAQRFWTRAIYEQDVSQITSIVPLKSVAVGVEGMVQEAVMNRLMGTSNRGFFINFESGPRFALIRGDMRDIDELMVALKERLGEERWKALLRLQQKR